MLVPAILALGFGADSAENGVIAFVAVLARMFARSDAARADTISETAGASFRAAGRSMLQIGNVGRVRAAVLNLAGLRSVLAA